MRIQAEEERTHANKIFDHILKRGGMTKVTPTKEVNIEKWKDHTAIWNDIVELEKETSKNILAVTQTAQELGDHTTVAFLQWFLLEQVEEEDTVNEILQKVNAMAKIAGLYYHIDHELGKRKSA
eukprot:TRINITY_DN2450_c0_g1_i2.p1 TRINITY_DN2450_c0_g1~~TRINITY_DN2450_c0_g1_i2.p1  ORF type:complete len:124 (+),score=34.93 TRINITY_DN2450_c0_g1_i2:233-604(+)